MEIVLTKMWFVWNERCNRVFQRKQCTPQQFSLVTQKHILFWTKKNGNTKKKIPKSKPLTKPWTGPVKNKQKINVDAAWISKYKVAGFALVLRDYETKLDYYMVCMFCYKATQVCFRIDYYRSRDSGSVNKTMINRC